MTSRHGLVLGKFYPPHAGHHFLIDTAAAVSDWVTVIVAAADVETIPLDLRVAWIRRAHAHQPGVQVVGCTDNHPIDYHDPAIWDLHMAVFRAALVHSPVRHPVDAVFTAEAYGPELGRRLGARWAGAQLQRQPHAISASDIRADPVAHWDAINPSVRAWFAKRVVVVGAESTGTTTLTRQLCDVYRARGGPYGPTQWVAEYGRELTWRKLATLTAEWALDGRPTPSADDLDWTDADFEEVVTAQNQQEDDCAALGGPLLLCDTDSWATRLWQQRYLGHTTPAVIAGSTRPDPSLYLVTHDSGVPFVQDGIRDGAHLRADMTSAFVDALTQRDVPYLVIDASSPADRLTTAVGAIDEVLERGWNLGVPPEYQQ